MRAGRQRVDAAGDAVIVNALAVEQVGARRGEDRSADRAGDVGAGVAEGRGDAAVAVDASGIVERGVASNSRSGLGRGRGDNSRAISSGVNRTRCGAGECHVSGREGERADLRGADRHVAAHCCIRADVGGGRSGACNVDVAAYIRSALKCDRSCAAGLALGELLVVGRDGSLQDASVIGVGAFRVRRHIDGETLARRADVAGDLAAVDVDRAACVTGGEHIAIEAGIAGGNRSADVDSAGAAGGRDIDRIDAGGDDRAGARAITRVGCNIRACIGLRYALRGGRHIAIYAAADGRSAVGGGELADAAVIAGAEVQRAVDARIGAGDVSADGFARAARLRGRGRPRYGDRGTSAGRYRAAARRSGLAEDLAIVCDGDRAGVRIGIDVAADTASGRIGDRDGAIGGRGQGAAADRAAIGQGDGAGRCRADKVAIDGTGVGDGDVRGVKG